MAQNDFDYKMLLDMYIHDYLRSTNRLNTAQVFLEEANVEVDSVRQGGFLIDWWSLFSDTYNARTNENHRDVATSYTEEINGELGVEQRSMPKDSSSIYGNGTTQAKYEICSDGLNKGVIDLQSKGSPLIGIENFQLSSSGQVQNSLNSTINQFQIMSPQQHILAQPQSQGRVGNPSGFLEMDPHKDSVSSMSDLNKKVGQTSGTKGFVSSPMQAVRNIRQDRTDYLIQMQQSTLQSEELPQQQQLQQNRQKGKKPILGDTNYIGTEYTIGNSSNWQSIPSSQTTGETVAMAGNMQHLENKQKIFMMLGTEGTDGLALPTNQMDCPKIIGDIVSFDDEAKSYFSHDDNKGEGGNTFYDLKTGLIDTYTKSLNGLCVFETGRKHSSNNKVSCCHFSSDGKILASAGDEKKVILWNMHTLQTERSTAEHSQTITDIRFSPYSYYLATTSFDRTVRLWNAADTRKSLHTYTGHKSHVTSLDFHPKNRDLLCSCDTNGDIRLWSVSKHSCQRVLKGATAKVRFQPRTGQLMAAVSESILSIFDAETNIKKILFQGHKAIRSLCWDTNGDFLATLCQDSVMVWSLSSQKHIHELRSDVNLFESCLYHPTYPNLIVIGGYQNLYLWDLVANKKITIPAHEGLVSDLAECPISGLIASASHDKSVKLWKSEYIC